MPPCSHYQSSLRKERGRGRDRMTRGRPPQNTRRAGGTRARRTAGPGARAGRAQGTRNGRGGRTRRDRDTGAGQRGGETVVLLRGEKRLQCQSEHGPVLCRPGRLPLFYPACCDCMMKEGERRRIVSIEVSIGMMDQDTESLVHLPYVIGQTATGTRRGRVLGL